MHDVNISFNSSDIELLISELKEVSRFLAAELYGVSLDSAEEAADRLQEWASDLSTGHRTILDHVDHVLRGKPEQ